MTALVHLIVVVPVGKTAVMIKQGYRPTDRANGFTTTMYRRCDTAAEAHQLGYKLPFIWAIEQVAA